MQLSKQKILLTGSCGFIGNSLTKMLWESGVDLVCLDKMTYVSNDKYHNKHRVPLYKYDICSQEAYNLVMAEKFDIVINMAAESHVDVSIKDPNIFVQSNVFGVTNLMNAAIKSETLPLFVQISTDEVYGDIATGWSKESDARKASSPYSASKAAAEHFVEAYGRTYKLPYLITRSSNNYGPYQDAEKFIPKAITNILSGKKVPIYGDGLQERDWIYVEDNCKGIVSTIKNYEFYGDWHSKEIFNIGGDKTYTNLEILSTISEMMNKETEDIFEYVTDRPGHDRRYAIDKSLIEGYAGWKASKSLEDGLAETIQWYKERL